MVKAAYVIFLSIILSMMLISGCNRQVYPESPAGEAISDVTADVVAVQPAQETPVEETPAENESAEAAPTGPYCGDGVCSGAENCDRCYKDCGCKSPAECYQGRCKVPECGSKGECDDKDPCTVDECFYAQHPNAYCGHELIKKCKNNDGCCAKGCTAETDSDCEPVCGNNICEVGEASESCEKDCYGGTLCGNGVCDDGESSSNCHQDCEEKHRCGDGYCDDDEDREKCPEDC
ncbi:hypothetical protein KY363_02655 [Candidatus Woesearchaeota archaeon]|nr:hypothetical protein [Candidatus Woesearchaeota archaeon]